MNILFIGDIFGRPGRTIVKDRLPELRKRYAVDLVIANCENAAAGFGITPPLAEELFDLGIDVMTTGNHVWDKPTHTNTSQYLRSHRPWRWKLKFQLR